MWLWVWSLRIFDERIDGPAFSTIHVSPEDGFSDASYEIMGFDWGLIGFKQLAQRVLSYFKPLNFRLPSPPPSPDHYQKFATRRSCRWIVTQAQVHTRSIRVSSRVIGLFCYRLDCSASGSRRSNCIPADLFTRRSEGCWAKETYNCIPFLATWLSQSH